MQSGESLTSWHIFTLSQRTQNLMSKLDHAFAFCQMQNEITSQNVCYL